jgi:hypothetical protein
MKNKIIYFFVVLLPIIVTTNLQAQNDSDLWDKVDEIRQTHFADTYGIPLGTRSPIQQTHKMGNYIGSHTYYEPATPCIRIDGQPKGRFKDNVENIEYVRQQLNNYDLSQIAGIHFVNNMNVGKIVLHGAHCGLGVIDIYTKEYVIQHPNLLQGIDYRFD